MNNQIEKGLTGRVCKFGCNWTEERLGHADVNLTLSTYSHVLDGMQAQASDKFESMFYQSRKAG